MRESKKGFTLLELIVVISIIVILASVSIPMVEVTIKRQKELELRRNLRIIRMAIDEFKKFVDENKVEVDDDTYGFPEKLEDLVQGIEYRDKQNNEKIQKFLRRVPIDPITRSFEWGIRPYQDDRHSNYWGGENVWDVYTKSQRKALDGTLYKDW